MALVEPPPTSMVWALIYIGDMLAELVEVDRCTAASRGTSSDA